ncbi:MAG: Coenzyme F420 hydrogenase/dehydrogenase, beta subunit C-terminal domain [Candidatus Bathyarchaeia archaeon]
MEPKERGLIAFDDLNLTIVSPGFCTLCGACEAACPTHSIRILGRQPKRVHDCSNDLDLCPICYDICPHSDALLMELQSFLQDAPIESENLGRYRRILLAQTTDPKIRELAGHSGGVVVSLLSYAMDREFIDGAVASEVMPNLELRPRIAITPDDVLSAVESKFLPSAVARAFGRLVYEYGRGRIAFVGTPCHVVALRKLEAWQHRLMEYLRFTIGLFCLWSFSLEHLLDHISSVYNINAHDIQRIDLARGFLVQTAGGTFETPIMEVKHHIMGGCKTCTDFSSEFADLSVGTARPLEGWSTVIVRTRVGEDILERAVIDGVIGTKDVHEEPMVSAHVLELAAHKRVLALEEIRRMKEADEPLPPDAAWTLKL